jgi:DNA-binding response OmpR family regulator
MTRPLPVFVLQRDATTERALGALGDDPRVEFVVSTDKQKNWLAGAQRASAVVVTTNSDPLSALLYAMTAGITVPVVIAAPKRFAKDRRDVLDAGATLLVATPISKTDVTRMVKLVAPHSTDLQADGAMHLVLDPIGRVVRLHAKSVQLSQREFAVLHCLAGRSGHPVSATEVLAYVWGDNPGKIQSREILDVYIFNLRKKLKRLGLPNAIRTVRSYGYALEPKAVTEKH